MTTIRRQLTWQLLLAFAAPLVLGGVGVFVTVRAELLEQFDSALRAKAMAIAAVTRPRGDQLDVDSSGRFMREFDAPVSQGAKTGGGQTGAFEGEYDDGSDVGFFEIRRTDGTPRVRSGSLGGADLPFVFGSPEDPAAWSLTLPSGVAGRALGFTFSPRRSREEPGAAALGDLILVVASDRQGLDQTLEILAFVLLGCGVALLATISWVVPRVLRRALAPINVLADEAARIDADSLATRFAAAGLPGELVPISARLNDLLSRLEHAFERERRFSADLAHELRTPVAELRSLAELALKWPDTRAAETDREALMIATHMEGIVSRLLALLRSERGQLTVARESVALDEMLKSAWQPFAARAAGRRLRVTWELPNDCRVETDPVLTRSILTNLIENAVEYTPEGGALHVEGRVEGDQFIVRVSNDVHGLIADDVPRLFDRFWRRDPARSGAEHSGLGLSLARAFARALGDELTATLDGDARLTLTLSGESQPLRQLEVP